MPPWWWGGKLRIMISSLFSPHFPLSSFVVLACLHLIGPYDFIENCKLTFLYSRLTRGFYLVVNHLRSCWYFLSLYSPDTYMPIFWIWFLLCWTISRHEQFHFRSCIIAALQGCLLYIQYLLLIHMTISCDLQDKYFGYICNWPILII